MKYLFVRPHDCVDKIFVMNSTKLMRVEQTKNDAKFCCTCWEFYIIYKTDRIRYYCVV